MHAGPVYNYTTGTPNSWMSVDLGAHVRLRPTHYCLRHTQHGADHALRHWVLEGSVDEEAWRVLRQHQNDTSLQAVSMSTAAWPVEAAAAAGEGEGEGGAAGYYRYFRVRQTGTNSSGGHNLMCAGMELYGTLRGSVFANAREVVLAGEQ